MTPETYLNAVLLGIVEGVTEFLPVSSTGHLILASELLGYDAARWALFNVVIQLGAILAIVVLYRRTFLGVLTGLAKRESGALRFTRNILLAFTPSVVLGLAFHDRIEALLGRADLVGWSLILGGIAILAIERLAPVSRPGEVADLPARTAIGVGLVQCVSMIPGVSRSGATIMGALAMGVERRVAAEFSFFLAVPTMLGASTLELYSNRAALTWDQAGVIAVGFATAFVVAYAVVRAFVAFVQRHGFAPFAWYRIAAGVAALLWLSAR